MPLFIFSLVYFKKPRKFLDDRKLLSMLSIFFIVL